MDTKNQNLVTTSRQHQNLRLCPECNAVMVAVERCVENSILFVWYECSRISCDGQWLQKISYDCTVEEIE